MKRVEKDSLGTMEIPADALFGIHSARAESNFPDNTRFQLEWYCSIGLVKKACYLAYDKYRKAISERPGEEGLLAVQMLPDVLNALIAASNEVSDGKMYDHFIVPAICGGAGTSINMNINEIITNRALVILGRKPGDYSLIDPVEHANIFQSTNDVIPTSLKVSVMSMLNDLGQTVNTLRQSVESLETDNRRTLRIGYTQMQEAVPTSLGQLFSTYSEALSRDWWRVSKCFERLKLVNLGGGAIGTGLAIPRYFIMEVVNQLQEISGLPVARSENMPDATSNFDSFVEVHGILKAHAVNLEKMVSDIRLLASDISGTRIIGIPSRQVGSSIMPGKINPVIPEFVISCAHRVYANDTLITSLAAQGCLELNAYLPVIGHALIESIKLLIGSNRTLVTNLFAGLVVYPEKGVEALFASPSITTALIPFVGYHKAEMLAGEMKRNNENIFICNERLQIIHPDMLKEILRAENLLKLGYTLDDLNPRT